MLVMAVTAPGSIISLVMRGIAHQRRCKQMTRKLAVLLAVMGLMVMAFAGVALAVTKSGDAGPNRLVGTAENDTLRGLGGADELIGRGDSDRLFGGNGGDLINARERGEAEDDLVDCGAGRDTVLTDNTTEDTIRVICEVVRRG
jgi:RTX calcium-binding nonapeptide repeat (4 copies)